MRTLDPILEAALEANNGTAVIKATVKNLAATSTPTVISYELDNLTAKLTIPHNTGGTLASNSTVFRIERGLLIDGVEYLVNSSWFVLTKATKTYQKDVLEGHILKTKKFSTPGDVPADEAIDAIIAESYVAGYGYTNAFEWPDNTPWWKEVQFLPDGRTLAFGNIRGLSGMLSRKYVAQLLDLGENVISVIDNGNTTFYEDPDPADEFITQFAETKTEIVDRKLRYFFYRDEDNTIHVPTFSDSTYPPHNLGFIPDGTTVYPLTGSANQNYATIAPPDLRAQNGDFFQWTDLDGTTQLNGYILIKEVFDTNSSPSWRMEIRTINILNNTEGGAMPSTIEAASPYTPLNVSEFDGILDEDDNNLQAAMETIDDHEHNTVILPAAAALMWKTRPSAADNSWASVTWSPELRLFVAVGITGVNNRAMTSPDGKTWTIRTTPSYLFSSIVWSPQLGLFVAVTTSGIGATIMTSPDGITWTSRTIPLESDWSSVTWSPELELFVAVSYSGTGNRVMTSPDGINWTIRTSAADNQWYSVTWSPELGLFVAVAGSGAGNRVMTSPDGINWTIRTSAANNTWRSVTWSPELRLFVAVGITGTGNRVMTSPDGISWTVRTSAADNSWASVAWSPELELFVAVAYTGTGNRVMTSPDGISWTIRTSAADNQWGSVAWSPELGVFAAVANTGTGNRVMTSLQTIAVDTQDFNSVLDSGDDNLQTALETLDDHIHALVTEDVQDIVGAMVSSNTESGIAVTYDDSGGKLNFDAQTAGDARYTVQGGWIEISSTWTRTGDHTYTVAGDVTATYRKGTKIRYKDGGGYEYGVIGSSSYSAPNTTVNLVPNSDHAMAAATITDKAISYIQNPDGFPDWFNYGVTWTSTGTQPAIGNGSLYGKWKARGKSIFPKVRVIMGSTTTFGTGNYNFSIPINSVDQSSSVAVETASGNTLDNSATTRYAINAFVRTSEMRGLYQNTILSPTVPFTYAQDDVINLSAEYEF